MLRIRREQYQAVTCTTLATIAKAMAFDYGFHVYGSYAKLNQMNSEMQVLAALSEGRHARVSLL